MNNIVIISSYRPDYQLNHLFKGLKEAGFKNIIIADDGSGDKYSGIYRDLETSGAVVIRHDKNEGKGASIKDSLTYVIKNFPDAPGVILADGDGQHTPKDILKISQKLSEEPLNIVLGVRNFKNKNISFSLRRRIFLTSLVYRINTGKSLSDCQTGLRGIPHNLIPFAASVNGTRFEYEANFLKEADEKNITVSEVEISLVFPKGNKVYYRPVQDSARLLKSPLLFFATSLSCSAVDILLFTLFAILFEHRTANNIIAATVFARLISGTLNFILTKNLCFSERGKNSFQLIKFFSFFTIQMFLSSTLVSLLSFVPIPLAVIKMIVDSCLFVLNYYVSRKWIFKT